jgi:hypothetical protein
MPKMMRIEVCIESRAEDARAPRETNLTVGEAVDGEGLDEASCRQVLEAVLEHLRAMKADRSDGDLHDFTFTVRIADALGGQASTWADYELFREAVAYEPLHPLMYSYAAETAVGAHGSSMWSDDETPSGTHAIVPLVMYDRKWIPAYVAYLRFNDLDHEVDQAGDIAKIVEKYGWAEDTCELAVARRVSCCGQAGGEQFEELLESGLSGYLDTEEGRAIFNRVAMREFEEWDNDFMRAMLETDSEEHFEGEIDFWVDLLEDVMTEEELEVVRKHAHGRWARARQASR